MRKSIAVCACAWAALWAGCGATKNRIATEQLLISDAVDRAVGEFDFAELGGQKVYLDTKYIEHIRGPNSGPGSVAIVNADYVISAVRQQMLADKVLLQTKAEDADFIVELRCGAIGSDSHEVVYGVPASNALSSASAILPGAPPIPAIPEIALAKRNDTFGAAKIGIFAYQRETKEPVWQAGIAQARSTSKDIWFFGAGPFQRGTIYSTPQFAGSKLKVPHLPGHKTNPDGDLVSFQSEGQFWGPDDAEHSDAAKKLTEKDPPVPEPGLLPDGAAVAK
jgi:hypothetical protein